MIRFNGVKGEYGVIEGDAVSRKYMHSCNYGGWPFSSDFGTM
jgi:hypothetical protein